MRTCCKTYLNYLLLVFLGTASLWAEWETVKTNGEPVARHEAAFIGFDGKFYLMGGRTASQETKQIFDQTVPEVDVYDIKRGEWSVLKEPLPTPRADNIAMTIGKEVVIIGGE